MVALSDDYQCTQVKKKKKTCLLREIKSLQEKHFGCVTDMDDARLLSGFM